MSGNERRTLQETLAPSPEPFIIPLDERHVPAAKQLWGTRFGGVEEHTDNWLHDARIEVDNPTQGFAAIHGATLAGFGIATIAGPEYIQDYVGLDIDVDPWPLTGILHILVVHEEYESQGIGSRLVEERLRWLSSTDAGGVIGVSWHREDHHDSRALFEKYGFEVIATVEEYYAQHDSPAPCVDCDGECRCDATIYRRPLGRLLEEGSA